MQRFTYVLVITSDHVAVRHVVAQTISRLIRVRLPRGRDAILTGDLERFHRRRHFHDGRHRLYLHRVLLVTRTRARPEQGNRRLVGWSLTSLFSTNMAISETKGQGWKVIRTQ